MHGAALINTVEGDLTGLSGSGAPVVTSFNKLTVLKDVNLLVARIVAKADKVAVGNAFDNDLGLSAALILEDAFSTIGLAEKDAFAGDFTREYAGKRNIVIVGHVEGENAVRKGYDLSGGGGNIDVDGDDPLAEVVEGILSGGLGGGGAVIGEVSVSTDRNILAGIGLGAPLGHGHVLTEVGVNESAGGLIVLADLGLPGEAGN